ncbi:MAG: hypothetical protein HYV07_10110 [Deltaproteobacteria bacterium]|nr:hypothetical protein [Deltaproteobacteria bacterium]
MRAPLVVALGPSPRALAQTVPTLDKPLSSALVEASTTPRGPPPLGTKPMLGRHERKRLSQLLEELPAARRAKVSELLQTLAGPAARGAFLRAVVARSPDVRAGQLSELRELAKKLSKDGEELARRRTTVLDLDATTNSNSLDPLGLSSRRGRVHALPLDQHADNDGLYQRFTASCGPTVVEMMVGESDPVFAHSIHEEGLEADATKGVAAGFQESVLLSGGGIPLGKTEAQIRARLRNAAGRLKEALDPKSLADLERFSSANGPRTTRVKAALELIRKKFDGFPTEAELTRLAASGPLPQKDEGTSTEAFLAAIHTHVTPRTGVRYAGTQPPEGFARGQAWRHLDAVTETLRQGIDVPFGVSEPAHWMLLTHVAGHKPNRRFLVSDPESGRTAWIPEKSLVKGSFVTDPFRLTWPNQRGYIDTFLLPVKKTGKSE